MTNTLIKQIEDLLTAVYLAGTENGLGRSLQDVDEINHRKEAFRANNPVNKEAQQGLIKAFTEAVERAEPKKKNTDTGDEVTEYIARAHNQACWEFKSNIKEEIGEL